MATLSELPNGLISECARAGNYANAAGLVDVAWHDADFTFAWRDDTGAIGAYQARLCIVEFKASANLGHIANGYSFGDTDHEWYICFDCFKDRVRSKGRRYVDDGSISPMFFDGFGYGVTNRDFIFPHLATFTRCHAGDDLSAVFNALLRVEGSGLTGNPLNDETCIFVD